jgi:hypothetical protein
MTTEEEKEILDRYIEAIELINFAPSKLHGMFKLHILTEEFPELDFKLLLKKC